MSASLGCRTLVKDGRWAVLPEDRPKGWEAMAVTEAIQQTLDPKPNDEQQQWIKDFIAPIPEGRTNRYPKHRASPLKGRGEMWRDAKRFCHEIGIALDNLSEYYAAVTVFFCFFSLTDDPKKLASDMGLVAFPEMVIPTMERLRESGCFHDGHMDLPGKKFTAQELHVHLTLMFLVATGKIEYCGEASFRKTR